MKILLRLLIAAAAIVPAVIFVTPVRLAAIAIARRSGGCSMAQSLDIPSHFKNETAIKDRILAASKKIQADDALELWETPYGPFWIPKGSQYVLPFNLAEQEMKIYGIGEMAVKPGDVVFDCGANIGVFIRESLKAGAAKVIAVEPAPENIECVRRNFKSELESGKVVLVQKGVWDKEDKLTLRIDPTNSAADSFVIQTKDQTKTVEVPLTTLDKIATDLGLTKVDYIKMDIEGAEPNALRGAAETIRKFKPRLSISAYHAPDHPVLVPKIIRETRGDYKMECGPCNELKGGFEVRPEILYFR